jgi:hypothetical protein
VSSGFIRRHVRTIAVALCFLPLYAAARLPVLAGPERVELASRFAFERIELPNAPLDDVTGPEYAGIRHVHPSLEKVSGWISVIGASAALADVDGDGLSNEVCWIDPRVDDVLVGPVPVGDGPEGNEQGRFVPFTLRPTGLPFDRATTAPMGCVPCDVNEDGLTDVLVTYWGRTPVLFLRRAGATVLESSAYRAVEIAAVPEGSTPERWFTNAATFADIDGDGHADLIIGNYFTDGARILDASDTFASETQQMQDSMTRAFNGGRNRVLLWSEASAGEEPSARFREAEGVLPPPYDTAWTLAIGAADLDGDLRPELYFANDFAPDLLLHNRSTAGEVELVRLEGIRTWGTPGSKVLGHDSFKGMGTDFADVDGDGTLDIYVSNITTEFGLEESQFLWMGTGETASMAEGIAPYVDEGEGLGVSRSGWAWDAKLADFDNDGVPEAMQAIGFLKGEVSRWPELHEIAMGNDTLLHKPGSWHCFGPGDDLSGDLPNPFFVLATDGRYYDLAHELGLDVPQNSRGIAPGDVDGDGDLDFVLANQWEPSAFHRNDAPEPGAFLGLHVLLPLESNDGPTHVHKGHPDAGEGWIAPTVRAEVRFEGSSRRLHAQVDNGNGHTGARSRELHFGLGNLPEGTEVHVELTWRDAGGQARTQSLMLTPEWHTVVLGSGNLMGQEG